MMERKSKILVRVCVCVLFENFDSPLSFLIHHKDFDCELFLDEITFANRKFSTGISQRLCCPDVAERLEATL